MSLLTQWQPEQIPLAEYPRPQFVRDSFLCLNGKWDYAFTTAADKPQAYDGEIVVPFSPESVLSGVGRQLQPNEYLHYRRYFEVEKKNLRGKVLLHFGAVDQDCECFINGSSVGSHKGGYLPFEFEISSFLVEGQNELCLTVTDVSDGKGRTTSKQRLKRGGIWYTATSGIWQTVWLECVSNSYIKNVRITPDYDNSCVHFQITEEGKLNNCAVEVSYQGEVVGSASFDNGAATVQLPDFHSWSPETPNLYDVVLTCTTDYVKSYFAMRKFSVEQFNGIKRLCLNNKPYFMNGLLDQGYWSDGIYTAPTDEALRYDVAKMRELGFNTLRKHIKIEPLRWYYHCDTIGMLVWQDMPSGGFKYSNYCTLVAPYTNVTLDDSNYRLFARKTKESRDEYRSEYLEMLNELYNVPSIAMWVPFNEGWGQFDAKTIAAYTRRIDSTRLVDHASGWHDCGRGDIKSLHVYFRKYRFRKDKLGRAVALTEFGGYGLKLSGHVYDEEKTFGYKNFENQQKLTEAYIKLYEKQIIPAIKKGLCACIYTQVSDVEDEINGLLTYDRAICKIDETKLQILNSKVCYDD